MDSKLYLERAENEIQLARIIFQITSDPKIQTETLHIITPLTFYSAVITHAYYSIFYTAKAYLLTKGVKTEPPEEHKKTYKQMKKLATNGAINKELIKIYDDIIIKADELIGIFIKEKKKRGFFTYQKLAQANKEPASESIKNAETFYKNFYNICNA